MSDDWTDEVRRRSATFGLTRASHRIQGLHHNSRIMGVPTITPTPEQQAVIDHRGR
ncbi:MAG TPA: hypothetical protein VLM40_15835 [Gemmata sp.]|nr:hypothetical protein [Gemmata sp.]